MSHYYGSALLEDWLAEEVFCIEKVPPEVTTLFEKWRESVEADIRSWERSDDGDGNELSWRGWGRGFYAIPDDEDEEFEQAIAKGREILESNREDER